MSAVKSIMHTIWADWLPASGHVVLDAPFFEKYTTDFDPETGLGGFEVWLPIASVV